MTDQFPEKFGKYKIIKEVGRGGFADVYRAIDTTLDRTVALKFLEPRLLREPIFVERFQREAQLAANLKHPNIVFIHEFGWEAGMVYLSMEFLEGQTLKEVILEEGALPPRRIMNMVEQMASALDYAHERGLVHRDIKPSNIMVGANDHVTVMDFGIAKAATQTALTTTGKIFGTPEYMSPEQAEGVEEPDARSDIYSLGVVVYEMFTGEVPFSGTTPLSILRGHADKPPPRPSEVNPDVSPTVEAVLLKALAKTPADRYQSAGEMAAALQQAVSGPVVEEVEAPPEPVLQPSLALRLSVKPQTVDVGGEAKWTVTLRNDGDDDLRHVTVRHDRTLLDEPFDLAAGKGRRFAFNTTYKTEGKKTEKVTATGIASTGQSVRDEAKATVRVAPVPPVVKKPVAEKDVAPLLVGWTGVMKEKARPPTVRPLPKPAITRVEAENDETNGELKTWAAAGVGAMVLGVNVLAISCLLLGVPVEDFSPGGPHYNLLRALLVGGVLVGGVCGGCFLDELSWGELFYTLLGGLLLSGLIQVLPEWLGL